MRRFYFLLFLAMSTSARYTSSSSGYTTSSDRDKNYNIHAPTLTSLTAQDDYGYQLKWEPVWSNDDDPVIGYKVKVWEHRNKYGHEEDNSSSRYDDAEPDSEPTNVFTTNYDIHELSSKGLEPGITYEFRVQAYTNRGDGPLSPPLRLKYNTLNDNRNDNYNKYNDYKNDNYNNDNYNKHDDYRNDNYNNDNYNNHDEYRNDNYNNYNYNKHDDYRNDNYNNDNNNKQDYYRNDNYNKHDDYRNDKNINDSYEYGNQGYDYPRNDNYRNDNYSNDFYSNENYNNYYYRNDNNNNDYYKYDNYNDDYNRKK